MSLTDYRAEAAKAMSERELQDNVIAMAKTLGYRCYHTYDSRRSEKGFPDLVLCKRGRVIFAELKAEKGRLTEDQFNWINDLQSVEDEAICVTYRDQWVAPSWLATVWYPRDWLAGRIETVLRGEDGQDAVVG